MKNPRHLSKALIGALFLSTLCAQGFSAAPPVENPFGIFSFVSPDDPPSGPNAITPMVYLEGPYSDTSYLAFGGNVDMAMDEKGKVLAISQVGGYEDKKQGFEVVRTLFVRTVNGVPILTANASAGGTYNDGFDDQPTRGAGKALIPLGPAPDPQGGFQEVSILSSFSGKRDKNSDKERPTESSLFLDASQLGDIVFKDWNMQLTIEEKFDARGRPYVGAVLELFKPDGSKTVFAEKKGKYSEKNGYSFSFSRGAAYDEFGLPKFDSRGRPEYDKYSQIKFSKLLLKKYFDAFDVPFWFPAAGAVDYKFFGQKGFGQVFNFDVFYL